MSNFDWQTEDEYGWDGEGIMEETAVSSNRFRPFLLILLAVALLGGAGYVVYRQAAQRVDTATVNVENDVLSTHNVALYAERQGDHELLRTILSGRDAAWADAQGNLLQEGLLFDRTPFGLGLVVEDAPLSLTDLATTINDENINVTLSPDFKEAELSFVREYGAAVGNGLTETVALEQTAVYRLGGERWLLAPPDSAFWGGTTTYEGRPLTLIYPKRDAEISEKLALALDKKLNETCQYLLDDVCPKSLNVYLTLSTDPASLLRAADPASMLDGRLLLELPAPTLVGIPMDEDGFQALYRGYGAQVVTAVIAQLNGWYCCDRAPIHQALLDRQLADLGLRPWPVDADAYRQAALGANYYNRLSALYMMDAFVEPDGEDGRLSYVLVEAILEENHDLRAADVERHLSASHGDQFITWIGRYLEMERTTDPFFSAASNFEEAWGRYAARRLTALQPSPPIPLPDQEIELLCAVVDQKFQQMEMSRYRLQTADWVEESQYEGFVLMRPLPNDDGVILSVIDFGTDEWQTFLQQGAETRLIADDGLTVSLGQTDPSQRYLVGLNASNNEYGMNVSLLDMEDCDQTGCAARVIGGAQGTPIWSPNGERTLVGSINIALFDPYEPITEVEIHRGDAELSTPLISVGEGYSPFWMDEETYGYVRSLPDGSSEIVIAAIADDELDVLLSLTDLLEALDLPNIQANDFEIHYATTHPSHPDLLFVMALDEAKETLFFFAFDRSSGAAETLFREARALDHSFGFSPDGRYLILTETAVDSFDLSRRAAYPNVSLHLRDMESGETQTFSMRGVNFMAGMAYDWSSDGEWLAYQANGRALNLVAPAHNYQMIIPHESGACTSLAWVNRSGE